MHVLYIYMYITDMTQRYSIVEARTSLPRIVDQAEAGIEVQLTHRGRPVAAVIGLRALAALRGGQPDFRRAYQTFLKRYSLDQIGLEPDFFAGVRDKRVGRRVSL